MRISEMVALTDEIADALRPCIEVGRLADARRFVDGELAARGTDWKAFREEIGARPIIDTIADNDDVVPFVREFAKDLDGNLPLAQAATALYRIELATRSYAKVHVVNMATHEIMQRSGLKNMPDYLQSVRQEKQVRGDLVESLALSVGGGPQEAEMAVRNFTRAIDKALGVAKGR